MTSCNYWKVIPQFVPLNSLHADICVLRIGAAQAERVYIFRQWKFVWEKNYIAHVHAQLENGITR